MSKPSPVDVCLVLEGTYPYIAGGVSKWTHDLLIAQRELSFHLVCLIPQDADLTHRYEVPANVKGITNIRVGVLPRGPKRARRGAQLLASLEDPLQKLQANGGLREISAVLEALRPFRNDVSQETLLNSPEAWDLLRRMYRTACPGCSFLDYFWTWRAILGGLYSVLLAPLPDARIYHAACTGYAGLLAARARIETGRPALLTEHGIYTNERRIEISMADWLHQESTNSLRLEKPVRDLKDLWIDTFTSYSRASYEAASRIITLYTGNQQLQIAEGADRSKLDVIPNGVDFDQISQTAGRRTEHPPTVALIGRVVPIKDIKTYIRAVAILRDVVPDVQALVLGPEDEDPDYFAQCRALVDHLGIQSSFTFTGRVSIAEYLPRIDVLVLTSISEAQPLVILEAGSAGIPTVATDVGACREMICGQESVTDSLGPGGEIVPLSNPTATASAVARLLRDRARWESASHSIRERVRLSYNKPALDAAYRDLYRYWSAAQPDPLQWKEAA
jgi:glycosyltransferase involved in cell wall biosynthesis